MERAADIVSTLVTHPILTVIALFVLYNVASTAIAYQRLKHIPGPPLAHISQLWLANAARKGSLYLHLQKILDQYGSPARIGPNMILFDDPEVYRAAFAPRSKYKRGPWYKGMQLDPRINNLLSERDEKRHGELRSKMIHAYTGKDVPEMETMIDERVQELIDLIQKVGVDQRQTIDFARIAQYFTLDSLTTIAFGKPVGFLVENTDLFDYNEKSAEFYPILALGATLETFNDILKSKFVQALAGPKGRDKAGLGAIIGWTQKIVADRFAEKPGQNEKRRVAMLDSFKRRGLTQVEAESESMLQLLAGSDSTATAIRMTVLYLLTNPGVYAKLRAEIDAAVSRGQVSAIIQASEAAPLPYLQAVVKESIRVWQPLTGIATKIAPPEGLTSYGRVIPGGTQLALQIQAMETRKDFFGPDAKLFRPERWVEADADTLKFYEKTWDLTFAGGQYSCPGKGVALMEISKVTFEVRIVRRRTQDGNMFKLLRRFDLGLVNPIKTMDSENHQLFVQKNMHLRVVGRV